MSKQITLYEFIYDVIKALLDYTLFYMHNSSYHINLILALSKTQLTPVNSNSP